MGPADSAVEPARDTAAAVAAVLTPAFLRKLDRLHLVVRRSLSTRPGNTPMPRGAQGSGIELESYKAYDPGDDLRHLDWNAYGRLDQLLIKTFRAEREAPLHVFVDISASMGVPATDNKIGFAFALALSLAYISLRNNDPVRIVALGGALPRQYVASPFYRHRQALHHLRDFVLPLRPQAQTALASGITAALREQRSPGVAIVLSDFLTEPDVHEAALADLVARRFTVAAVRIIGPGERDPVTLFRRGRLVDAETGTQRYITLSADNQARYQSALAEHLQRLRAFCTRCGIACSVADTPAGLEQTLFHDLPALGLIH
jgi:uncharacterized protein (DUF58 family)